MNKYIKYSIRIMLYILGCIIITHSFTQINSFSAELMFLFGSFVFLCGVYI